MPPTLQPAGTAHRSTSGLDAESYRFLREYIHRESGIMLDDDKHYLVEARLVPLVEQTHLGSLAALCRALQQNDVLLRKKVVEAMTTHETLFFRDAAPFDGLRTTILPQLIEKHKNSRTLNIWSAAASSGQEAYSLSMLLLEMHLTGWNVQIFGTDLSEQILARAREARYLQLEVNRGLPVQYLIKYFERDGLDWRIKEHVRKMVRFEQFDLRRPARGKGPFDIIFCRNVLIYFDIPTKKEILANLRTALVPGGYLVLGSAESTLSLDETFRRIAVGKAMFYQAPE
ncbi:MAG: protein-glutamate O-methyltransferase CheR [Bryobacteraceae bacterium]